MPADERSAVVPGSIKVGDKLIEFFVPTGNLGRAEAVECERKWKGFLNINAAIEDSRYKAGKILEEIRTKLLEERMWVQFLKEGWLPAHHSKGVFRLRGNGR